MSVTLGIVFYIVAVILFILGVVGVGNGRVIPAGLAFFALGHIF